MVMSRGGRGGGSTPPKFNMEPENDGFQEELPFQVPC